MADAVFKGYGGAGYTHSGGGGLLQPNDFHGMAALLVEAKSDSPDSGMHRRRREALRRLLDPIHGNILVRSTLTCLEREIDGAMPTICEGSDDGGSEDERDGDGSQIRAQLLHGQTFTGAATSMLPPGETPAAVDNADPTVALWASSTSGVAVGLPAASVLRVRATDRIQTSPPSRRCCLNAMAASHRLRTAPATVTTCTRRWARWQRRVDAQRSSSGTTFRWASSARCEPAVHAW
eukprot:scaffold59066_cov93-Phaeocystis_antarctica.AAC.1